MKLLIAAGGTGGHIFPGIAVAEAFVKERPGNEVLFVGTPYGLETKIIPPRGYRLRQIEARTFLGRNVSGKVMTLAAMAKGLRTSLAIIGEEKPDAIMGFGGFTCVPVVLAGRLAKVPCFLHEQNVSPGLANKLLSRCVLTTFVSFEGTGKYLAGRARVVRSGNPIRRELRVGRAAKEQGPFSVLVFGGSRGARAINDGMIGLLPLLGPSDGITIYHQTGTEDYERVREAYRQHEVKGEVFPFTDRMEKYYMAADVVVSRAGASTIFELSYFRKPAILIPYPFSAGDHQWKNASYVEAAGGARVIANAEASGTRIYDVLSALRADPSTLARMGERIASIYVEDAEMRLARGVIERVS